MAGWLTRHLREDDDRESVLDGEARPRPTGRPCPGPLCLQDPLGDVDLRQLRREVGPRGVVGPAVGLPRPGRELQAAVVAVAGVDRPVPSALAQGHAVPDRLGRVGGAGQRDAEERRGDGASGRRASAPGRAPGGRGRGRRGRHGRSSRGGAGAVPVSVACDATPRPSHPSAMSQNYSDVVRMPPARRRLPCATTALGHNRSGSATPGAGMLAQATGNPDEVANIHTTHPRVLAKRPEPGRGREHPHHSPTSARGSDRKPGRGREHPHHPPATARANDRKPGRNHEHPRRARPARGRGLSRPRCHRSTAGPSAATRSASRASPPRRRARRRGRGRAP